jgi:phage tail-like protein
MAPEHGLNLRFQVTVDEHQSLGNWSKCEGLTVEVDVFEYREGGQNTYVHRIPGRRKYQNIKLTRPLDKSTAEVAAWVSKLDGPIAGHTAQIKVLDAQGETVASWDLADVYPQKWTGPSLDINGKETAFEVLELAHNGFLAAG